MFLVGQMLFLSMFWQSHGSQSSFFTIGQRESHFQPADLVELLLTINRSGTTVTCATHCLGQKLCRTFEQNSDSRQCRLFEGSIETGTLVSTSSNTVVGWIPIEAALFTLYGAPQSQCADDRFLEIDLSSGRCGCPMYTFWNGSICVNQRFNGAACLNDSWCRTDVGVNCHASTCVNGYPPLITDTTLSTFTQIASMEMTTNNQISTPHTATTAVTTCTTLITFDDLPPTGNVSTVIPNGYKNLNWTNAEYINASSMPGASGYGQVVTRPNVAHNPTENNITISTADETRFSFDSIHLTSAWRNGLNVSVLTLRESRVTSAARILLNPTQSFDVYCTFCTNIDTITIQAMAGTPIPTLTENGTQVTIDNLCISF